MVYPVDSADLVQLAPEKDRRVSGCYDVFMGELYVAQLPSRLWWLKMLMLHFLQALFPWVHI